MIQCNGKLGYGMTMKRIQIKTQAIVKEAVLNDSVTAEAIWNALPIEGRVNRWGDEIYFSIPVKTPVESTARDEVKVGDLAYWAPGKAFCIFWGPTPASHGNEPRAASPVNVFGQVFEDPEDFGDVENGANIWIEAIYTSIPCR
jgi:hypothetical protein